MYQILSHVIRLGAITASPMSKPWEEIAAIPADSPLNCADKDIETQMIAHIDEAKQNGDTLGGIFEVVARGVPVGLGSHTSWEDKLDGRIARAIMSIHAVKAVELGTGVANAGKLGSEVHDEIFSENDGGGRMKDETDFTDLSLILHPSSFRFVRKTNRAGGLEGGITNGEEVRVRGYLKPISTLRKALNSVDIDTKEKARRLRTLRHHRRPRSRSHRRIDARHRHRQLDAGKIRRRFAGRMNATWTATSNPFNY